MSKPLNMSQDRQPIEDQLEILTQEFEYALRWQQPAIFMITYGSIYVRNDSVSMLENFLIDHGQKVVLISAKDVAVNSLEFWDHILVDVDNIVFFLEGFAELKHQNGLINILNHYAYMFIEKNVRLVFWLTFKEASALAYQAPALWVRRQRLIELTASPKPEQLLQSALENVWQGTGEYCDQFEDTEAKIYMRESILTELPTNNETSSIRANLLLTLGILQWRRGDYEKANEMLHRALMIAAKIQDNWFEAKCFNAIALVKSSLGNNEEAIDSYKQAIKLAPQQIFVWNNLGILCLKIGRNHEAMIAFQKSIEHNPSDPVAWNGMGDVYSRSEYIDDAIAAYRKSIELAALLPHPWNGLGEVYARSGRPNEAVSAFQKAIQLNSRFIQPWLGLARLSAHQERYRDASKAYQQALILDPQNSSIWNELGSVFIQAKRFDDAVDSLKRAIEFDRNNGWAYSNLGLVYANNEKIEKSIPLYLKALDMIHDDKQRNLTWNRLANSYRMINEYERAIKAYQMADSNGTDFFQTLDKDLQKTKPAYLEAETLTSEAKPLSLEEEAKVKNQIEDQAIESENNREKETPCWIFQATHEEESLTNNLFQKSSQLFNSKMDHPVVQAATSNKEIGGTTMQMLPNALTKDMPRLKSIPLVGVKNTTQVEADDARMWNEKGNMLLRSGEIENAINAYNSAIQLDRRFGWSYTNLGVAYLQLGKYAEAVLFLQKSLELLKTDKDRAVTWNALGNLYRCLNDYHNAIVSFQKADELDPEREHIHDTVEYLHSESTVGNVQVWYELGDSFFKAGGYAEASNCYRKVTEMAPLNGWAFKVLALSLTYQSKFNEAVSVYLKSIELFDDDKEKADTWNRLGNVYRRLNDYDHAVDAYQKAVKLNKEPATLLSRARFSLLGNCYVD
jgi:superkiller protein 3